MPTTDDHGRLVREIDFVVMGRFSAVDPIRRALTERGVRVAMIIGGEPAAYVARIIRASTQGVITVGLAPSLGDKLVVEALSEIVQSRRQSIFIPDENHTSFQSAVEAASAVPATGEQSSPYETPPGCSVLPPSREEVFVRSGPAIMGPGAAEPNSCGPTGESGEETGQRQEVVVLPSYSIDLCPVTNRDYAEFASVTGYEAEGVRGWGSWQDHNVPDKAQHPVVCVSWQDILAFLDWTGRHLPTEPQWVKAARFGKATVFPWGDDFDQDRCNLSGIGTTPVKAFPEGLSQTGCYDMAGNVWEVVIDPSRVATMGAEGVIPEDPNCPYYPRVLTLKGGAFDCLPADCRCSSSRRISSGTRFDRVGFRTTRVS